MDDSCKFETPGRGEETNQAVILILKLLMLFYLAAKDKQNQV